MERHIPVYVSYSGRNGEASMQIMEAVHNGGYSLAVDCMLPSFDNLEARVQRLIEDVARDGAVVAVINAEGDTCPYLERDLCMAMEAKAKLLAVLVGDAVLPAKYEQALQSAVCRVSEYPTQQEVTAILAVLREILEAKS